MDVTRILYSLFLALFLTLIFLVIVPLFSGCDTTNDPQVFLGAANNNGNNDTTDGNKPDPSKIDTDGDGLMDSDETLCGADIKIPDTDGDTLGDHAECKTYHTDPTKIDTDGDGKSDMQELLIDHTDPLNPDHDSDGYAAAADLPGWPAEADCDDNDAARHPGAQDQVGNLVDFDCKPDVTTAHRLFGKGYNVEVTLNTAGNGVFIRSYLTTGPATSNPAGEFHGETLVDPTLPDIQDGLPGDGCNANAACTAASDYVLQPFGVNKANGYVFESTSWKYCFGHYIPANHAYVPDNPNCTQPLILADSYPSTTYALAEGVGFRVEKLGSGTYEVTAVGKNSNSNNPEWQVAVLVVGE